VEPAPKDCSQGPHAHRSPASQVRPGMGASPTEDLTRAQTRSSRFSHWVKKVSFHIFHWLIHSELFGELLVCTRCSGRPAMCTCSPSTQESLGRECKVPQAPGPMCRGGSPVALGHCDPGCSG
jgi:hypothetical protein